MTSFEPVNQQRLMTRQMGRRHNTLGIKEIEHKNSLDAVPKMNTGVIMLHDNKIDTEQDLSAENDITVETIEQAIEKKMSAEKESRKSQIKQIDQLIDEKLLNDQNI